MGKLWKCVKERVVVWKDPQERDEDVLDARDSWMVCGLGYASRICLYIDLYEPYFKNKYIYCLNIKRMNV